MSTSSWLSSRSHLDSRWRLWAWQPASTPSTTWGMTMINCLGDLAGTTIVGHAEKKRVRKEGRTGNRTQQPDRSEVPMRNPSCLTFKTIYFASHQKNSPACAASSIDAAQAGGIPLFLRVPSLLQSTAAVLDGCRNLLGLLGSLKKTYQFKAKIQRISQAPASGDIAVSDNALACVGYPGKLLLKSRITGGCPAL